MSAFCAPWTLPCSHVSPAARSATHAATGDRPNYEAPAELNYPSDSDTPQCVSHLLRFAEGVSLRQLLPLSPAGDHRHPPITATTPSVTPGDSHLSCATRYEERRHVLPRERLSCCSHCSTSTRTTNRISSTGSISSSPFRNVEGGSFFHRQKSKEHAASTVLGDATVSFATTNSSCCCSTIVVIGQWTTTSESQGYPCSVVVLRVIRTPCRIFPSPAVEFSSSVASASAVATENTVCPSAATRRLPSLTTVATAPVGSGAATGEVDHIRTENIAFGLNEKTVPETYHVIVSVLGYDVEKQGPFRYICCSSRGSYVALLSRTVCCCALIPPSPTTSPSNSNSTFCSIPRQVSRAARADHSSSTGGGLSFNTHKTSNNSRCIDEREGEREGEGTTDETNKLYSSALKMFEHSVVPLVCTRGLLLLQEEEEDNEEEEMDEKDEEEEDTVAIADQCFAGCRDRSGIRCSGTPLANSEAGSASRSSHADDECNSTSGRLKTTTRSANSSSGSGSSSSAEDIVTSCCHSGPRCILHRKNRRVMIKCQFYPYSESSLLLLTHEYLSGGRPPEQKKQRQQFHCCTREKVNQALNKTAMQCNGGATTTPSSNSNSNSNSMNSSSGSSNTLGNENGCNAYGHFCSSSDGSRKKNVDHTKEKRCGQKDRNHQHMHGVLRLFDLCVSTEIPEQELLVPMLTVAPKEEKEALEKGQKGEVDTSDVSSSSTAAAAAAPQSPQLPPAAPLALPPAPVIPVTYASVVAGTASPAAVRSAVAAASLKTRTRTSTTAAVKKAHGGKDIRKEGYSLHEQQPSTQTHVKSVLPTDFTVGCNTETLDIWTAFSVLVVYGIISSPSSSSLSSSPSSSSSASSSASSASCASSASSSASCCYSFSDGIEERKDSSKSGSSKRNSNGSRTCNGDFVFDKVSNKHATAEWCCCFCPLVPAAIWGPSTRSFQQLPVALQLALEGRVAQLQLQQQVDLSNSSSGHTEEKRSISPYNNNNNENSNTNTSNSSSTSHHHSSSSSSNVCWNSHSSNSIRNGNGKERVNNNVYVNDGNKEARGDNIYESAALTATDFDDLYDAGTKAWLLRCSTSTSSSSGSAGDSGVHGTSEGNICVSVHQLMKQQPVPQLLRFNWESRSLLRSREERSRGNRTRQATCPHDSSLIFSKRSTRLRREEKEQAEENEQEKEEEEKKEEKNILIEEAHSSSEEALLLRRQQQQEDDDDDDGDDDDDEAEHIFIGSVMVVAADPMLLVLTTTNNNRLQLWASAHELLPAMRSCSLSLLQQKQQLYSKQEWCYWGGPEQERPTCIKHKQTGGDIALTNTSHSTKNIFKTSSSRSRSCSTTSSNSNSSSSSSSSSKSFKGGGGGNSSSASSNSSSKKNNNNTSTSTSNSSTTNNSSSSHVLGGSCKRCFSLLQEEEVLSLLFSCGSTGTPGAVCEEEQTVETYVQAHKDQQVCGHQQQKGEMNCSKNTCLQLISLPENVREAGTESDLYGAIVATERAVFLVVVRGLLEPPLKKQTGEKEEKKEEEQKQKPLLSLQQESGGGRMLLWQQEHAQQQSHQRTREFYIGDNCSMHEKLQQAQQPKQQQQHACEKQKGCLVAGCPKRTGWWEAPYIEIYSLFEIVASSDTATTLSTISVDPTARNNSNITIGGGGGQTAPAQTAPASKSISSKKKHISNNTTAYLCTGDIVCYSPLSGNNTPALLLHQPSEEQQQRQQQQQQHQKQQLYTHTQWPIEGKHMRAAPEEEKDRSQSLSMDTYTNGCYTNTKTIQTTSSYYLYWCCVIVQDASFSSSSSFSTFFASGTRSSVLRENKDKEDKQRQREEEQQKKKNQQQQQELQQHHHHHQEEEEGEHHRQQQQMQQQQVRPEGGGQQQQQVWLIGIDISSYICLPNEVSCKRGDVAEADYYSLKKGGGGRRVGREERGGGGELQGEGDKEEIARDTIRRLEEEEKEEQQQQQRITVEGEDIRTLIVRAQERLSGVQQQLHQIREQWAAAAAAAEAAAKAAEADAVATAAAHGDGGRRDARSGEIHVVHIAAVKNARAAAAQYSLLLLQTLRAADEELLMPLREKKRQLIAAATTGLARRAVLLEMQQQQLSEQQQHLQQQHLRILQRLQRLQQNLRVLSSRCTSTGRQLMEEGRMQRLQHVEDAWVYLDEQLQQLPGRLCEEVERKVAASGSAAAADAARPPASSLFRGDQDLQELLDGGHAVAEQVLLLQKREQQLQELVVEARKSLAPAASSSSCPPRTCDQKDTTQTAALRP